MPDTPPTPGQVNYEAFWLHLHLDAPGETTPALPWDRLPPGSQAAWEAAAQAVLALTSSKETADG